MPLMFRLVACSLSLLAIFVCTPAAGATVVVDVQSNAALITSDGEPLYASVSLTRSGDGYLLRVADLSGGVPRSSLVLAGQSFGACSVGASANEVACELAIWDGAWPVVVTGTPGGDIVRVVGTAKANVSVSTAAGSDTVDVHGTDFIPAIDLGDDGDVLHACGCGIYDLDAELVLHGGAGDDLFTAERSTTPLSRGWGGTYIIGPDFETVTGSPFNDHLFLASPNIDAGAGDDEVYAPVMNATVSLGDGNDRFWDDRRPQFAHHVSGGAGTDSLLTRTIDGDRVICLDPRPKVCGAFDGRKNERDRYGEDIENVDLRGVRGNHVVVGSRFANRIQGSNGNDTFIGGEGADVFTGGAGVDVVFYSYRPVQPRSVHLTFDGRPNDGGPRDDTIGTDIEIMVGSAFGDVLVGSGGHDGMYGDAGNDSLTGGRGSDYLDGGAGNDVINARDGRRDKISCGAGRDTVRADKIDIVATDCEIR